MAISSELLNVDHFMSLIRNSAYNLLGAVVPAVAALLTVPAIVANLGTDEYGVLVLVTSIVGYFALLDVNVTAASIKYLAEYNARRDGHRVAQVWTFGLVLYASIGLIGGGAISIAAHALAVGVFKIPPLLQPEAVAALRWAGLGFAAGQLQFGEARIGGRQHQEDQDHQQHVDERDQVDLRFFLLAGTEVHGGLTCAGG